MSIEICPLLFLVKLFQNTYLKKDNTIHLNLKFETN